MKQGDETQQASPVTWREMALVVVFAALIMALTAAPYIWAVNRAEPDQQFQGFIWGVDDGNVYLQWIRQASEGRTFLRNQYTIEPQDPHFFNVFLLALGRVTAWTGQPPAVIFHAARLLGGIVLLTTIYLLAAFLSRSRAVRWATLTLASLGSGFGWLAALWASTIPHPLPTPLHPPDYAPLPPQTWQVQPEAVTFLSLLLNPLFVWSVALMCLVLMAAVKTLESRSYGWAAVTGLLLLVIGNVHGYDLFPLHGAIVLFGLVSVISGQISFGRAAGLYVVLFAIGAAAPVWAWWAANQDPAYMAKVQTPTLSPRIRDMAVGYGLPLLLAIPGVWYAVRRWNPAPRLMLPVCWMVSHVALLWAVRPAAEPEFHWEPLFNFQRKMAEGLHIPICLLAAVGLVKVIAPRLRGSSDAGQEDAPEAGVLPAGVRAGGGSAGGVGVGVVIALAVVLSMPSNVLFVSDCMHHVETNNRDLLRYLQPPIYLSFDQVRGIERLAAEADPDDIVMCSSLMGSHIPPSAKCRVFAGHWAETLHFGRAVDAVGKFLLPGRSAEVLRGWLDYIDADYVVYGPLEALLAQQVMLSSDQAPPDDPAAQFRETTADFLVPIFQQEDVTVYEFRPGLTPQSDRLPRVPGATPLALTDREVGGQ